MFIRDVDEKPALYTENKVPRREFARALQECFSNDPKMKELAWRCLKEKSYVLNGFYDLLVRRQGSEKQRDAFACVFLREVRDGTGMEYQGRIDYVPDEVERI